MSQPEFFIRTANIDDASAIASVLQLAFAEYESAYTAEALAATTPTAAQIRARFVEGPVWVALFDETIIGTVAAVSRQSRLYVRSMAILPNMRGRGIGYALLKTVDQFAHDNNHAELFLSTTPFLRDAILLYERFGFRRTGDAPHELFGTPLFTMVKSTIDLA